MAFLVANLPPIKVFVKKQYLYDHKKGQGEFVEDIGINPAQRPRPCPLLQLFNIRSLRQHVPPETIWDIKYEVNI